MTDVSVACFIQRIKAECIARNAVLFCASFKGSLHVLRTRNEDAERRYHLEMVLYAIVRYPNATETAPRSLRGGSDTLRDLKNKPAEVLG
jgi:hypothetical protein